MEPLTTLILNKSHTKQLVETRNCFSQNHKSVYQHLTAFHKHKSIQRKIKPLGEHTTASAESTGANGKTVLEL